MDFLCDLVREIVDVVKSNVEVDWTKPHRENVRAGVRSAIKRVLRRNEVDGDDMQVVQEEITEQAESLYGDWPHQLIFVNTSFRHASLETQYQSRFG